VINLEIEHLEDGAKVRLDGDMTIYGAAELKPQLLAALAEHTSLTLDLAAVDELDSAGVQLLLLLKQEADRQHKALRLTHHSEPTVEVFELLHLAPIFGDPVLLRAERA